MSPEQCEGRAVDARSDVFALGAVLYEMATGARAFAGDTAAGIVSSILRLEPPPPSSIRPEVPAQFDRLVGECLAKDPDRRWQSAHDVALGLAAIADTGSALENRPAARRRPLALLWAASIVATALVAALASRIGRPDVVRERRLELQVSPPVGTTFSYQVETVRFAVSPNGEQLAFIAADPGAEPRVWIRPLSSVESKPVAGTEGAVTVFWSPDGRAIAFVTGDVLKRLDLASGAAVSLCKVPRMVGISGTWNQNGEILFAAVPFDTLYRVSTAGGDAAPFVKPDPSREEVRVASPSFLPDGKRYLYVARRRDGGSFLMLGEIGKDPRIVMPIESNAQYVEPGLLVYAKGGALVARSFDAATGHVSGEPFAVAESVRFFLQTSTADFSASPTGAIVFQSHKNRSRLAWLDRAGHEVGTVGSPGEYLDVRIDRGGQAALATRKLQATGTWDIWSYDLGRNTETRMTLDDVATEFQGITVPGGDSMIFVSARHTAPRLVRRDLRTGRDEILLPHAQLMQETADVSPDGQRLVYEERTVQGAFNLWTLPLTGSAPPSQIRHSTFNETQFRFAPDGDHYTFLSDESGRPEVYVSSLSAARKAIVSNGGGFDARWSRDGREIVYVSSDLRMMSVPLRTTPTVDLGTPATLFAIASRHWISFDVAPDGNRFLVIVPEVVANDQPLTAILNMPKAPGL